MSDNDPERELPADNPIVSGDSADTSPADTEADHPPRETLDEGSNLPGEPWGGGRGTWRRAAVRGPRPVRPRPSWRRAAAAGRPRPWPGDPPPLRRLSARGAR